MQTQKRMILGWKPSSALQGLNPGPDNVVGCTPDGKQVVYRSPRNSYTFVGRLFTMPAEGTKKVSRALANGGLDLKSASAGPGAIVYEQLGTLHLFDPNSGNRYYFSQIGKEGAVIDERFNGGGFTADYIIDYLRRPLLNYRTTRDGEDFTTPLGGIFGPKAMIINEYAGSGGDALPWYFRKAGIGPLIGKRTWGGLVGGLGGVPALMDGGFVGPPAVGFWNPDGSWDVENIGVPPDIEVDLDPAAVRQGRDPQLEKAVEFLLEALKKNPPPKHKRPAFPNYHSPRKSG